MAEALDAWKTMVMLQSAVDTRAGSRIEGGSTSGFQFDPSDEALHDKLPGGWVR